MNAKPQRYAIVGMKHRGAEKFVADLAPVWAPDGDSFRHVGFVPKTQNAVLAAFIDANGLPFESMSASTSRALADSAEAAGIDPGSAVAIAKREASNNRAIQARLHKGSNVHPLAEVG